MNPDSFIKIGKIIQANGLKGALKCSFEAFFIASMDQFEVFFIKERSGSVIPFFVDDKQAVSENIYVLEVEDVDSREAAQKLKSIDIWVDPEKYEGLEELSKKEEGWNVFIGFTIADESFGEIGKIADIYELDPQIFASVMVDGEEKLIPLHEDLILEVDQEKKHSLFDLPEGILDL